jgi:hypothetical protein
MWKREKDRDSKTKSAFTLDHPCLKDCMVITTPRKDLKTLQYSSRFNQILPTEARRVQFAWRKLIE